MGIVSLVLYGQAGKSEELYNSKLFNIGDKIKIIGESYVRPDNIGKIGTILEISPPSGRRNAEAMIQFDDEIIKSYDLINLKLITQETKDFATELTQPQENTLNTLDITETITLAKLKEKTWLK